MRISDWSSDVCSSDLLGEAARLPAQAVADRLRGLRRIGPAGFAGLVDGVVALLDAVLGQDALLDAARHAVQGRDVRSEERSVGKECVSTFRSRWSPVP